MVRNRIRKSNKGSFTEQTIKDAVDLVIIDGFSIQNVAERKALERKALDTYVKPTKNNLENLDLKRSLNYSCRKNFNQEKEKSIEDYLVKCSQINYELTKVNVQIIIYKLATKNNRNIL